MSIWKEQPTPPKTPLAPEIPARNDSAPRLGVSEDAPRRTSAGGKESLIASDITIEGKIEGAGHVRIAGRFKGDVIVQGDVTIESGAKVTGGVRANTVVIGGELDGNIDGATRVELLQSGIMNGDVKAGTFIVAAGSKMRGQVEFGWEGKPSQKAGITVESGSAA
ncbi:MAG: polymer-forming cytoskeletal protein [Gemmatimonadales bacterium]